MAKKRKEKDHLPEGARVLARNRKARHDYHIHERIEAGAVLVGSEVKSLRDSLASIAEGYAVIRGDEVWLENVQINEYPWAHRQNHEPTRTRKLLLHKAEIRKLATRTQQRGFTLVPLSIYLKEGKIKVELGLVTSKKKFEKRQSKKEADDKREIDRALSRRALPKR